VVCVRSVPSLSAVVVLALAAGAARAAPPGEQAERVAAARLLAGECQGAVSAYRAAVQALGTSERHLGLGQALLCSDRPEEAYPHIRLAVEARGGNETASLRALVDACLRLGRDREAAGLLDQFGVHPKHQRFALQRRAALLRRQGDTSGALAAIRSVEGPFSAWDHRALCVLMLERGEPRQALPHCHEASKRGALGPEWQARALARLKDPARAAEVLRPAGAGELGSRWRDRLAARYLLASGDPAGAAGALDDFAAAGGQSPGLRAERARIGPATRFDYSATGRSGGGDGLRYQSWDHGPTLSGWVPLAGGLVLRPAAGLSLLSESIEQPDPALDFDRERRRTDLDLGLMRRWPQYGLGLSGRAGISILDRQRTIPRAAVAVRAAPGQARRARLGLDLDYGPAERAGSVAYGIHRLHARLAADIAVAPLRLRASVEHRHYFLPDRTPRELLADGEVDWPLELGPLRLAPGLGLSVDGAWREPEGGVPVDLCGDRLGLWLRARLGARELGPLALRALAAWAPVSRGYRGEGFSPAGDGPWRIEFELTLQAAAWAELGATTAYSDELDRRIFSASLQIRLRP